MEWKLKGSFTVEAACLLPMTILAFAMIIYLVFLAYDSCIIQSNAYLAGEKTAWSMAHDSEAAIAEIRGLVMMTADRQTEEQTSLLTPAVHAVAATGSGIMDMAIIGRKVKTLAEVKVSCVDYPKDFFVKRLAEGFLRGIQ